MTCIGSCCVCVVVCVDIVGKVWVFVSRMGVWSGRGSVP